MNSSHGGDIYQYNNITDFSSNINPFGTPDFVMQAVKNSLDAISYYPDITNTKLREAIAKKEGVSCEDIICGNGASELIYTVVNCIKPKRAILSIPCFSEYLQVLENNDVEILFHNNLLLKNGKIEGGNISESLLDIMDESIDLLFICNPNNPTGATATASLLKKVIQKAVLNDIFIVIDESFLDFCEAYDELTVMHIANEREMKNIFIIRSFTKMYGLAGVRIGYGISFNNQLLQKVRKILPPWNISCIAQSAGISCCMDTEYSEKTRNNIKTEAEYITGKFDEMGISYIMPMANYVFFKSRPDLKDRLLEKGILIRDCADYKGLEKGFFRIAIKTHGENERLIQELSNTLG